MIIDTACRQRSTLSLRAQRGNPLGDGYTEHMDCHALRARNDADVVQGNRGLTCN